MREPSLSSGNTALRVLDWSNISTELLWVYEGVVAPEYRNVTKHLPGQSAFLMGAGSALVRTPAGEIRARAGQWVLPKQGERLQVFSDDASILSIHYRCQWPGGQPLFDWDVACVFASSKAPRLESEARRLLRQVVRKFPGANTRLARTQCDLKTYLWLQRHFAAWIYAYGETLTALGFPPARLGPVDERVLRVVRLLDEHPLDAELHNTELTSKAGVSMGQLDRLFVKQFNLTPRQYFDRRKIEIAAAALQSSAASIKQISYDLGFKSLPYFSRWFRSKTGMPPRHFRNSRRLLRSRRL